MKTLLILILVLASSALAVAQVPTPSPSGTADARLNGTPSPTAHPEAVPNTTVKVSTTGIELSGFPTWIIWLVLGVGAVAFLIWYLLLRSDKAEKSRLGLVSISILALPVLFVLVGYWLGRRWSNDELQAALAARTTVTVPAPTPQVIQVHDRSATDQIQVDNAGFYRYIGYGLSYIVILFELNMLLYIWFRWGPLSKGERQELHNLRDEVQHLRHR